MYRLFGPGSTLPGLSAAGLIGSLVVQDASRLAPASATTATVATALTAVAILKTGHPDYLTFPARRPFHVALASAAAAVVAVLAVVHGFCTSAGLDTTAVARPLALASAVAVVLALLQSKYESKAPVLGPFFDFERRATVLTVRVRQTHARAHTYTHLPLSPLSASSPDERAFELDYHQTLASLYGDRRASCVKNTSTFTSEDKRSGRSEQ
jgi:hypothetical protein